MNRSQKSSDPVPLRVLPLGLRRTTTVRDFDLHALVQEMYPQLRGLLRDNIELHLAEPAGKSCIIRGDPERMRELIVHLALDAQDAMVSGGVIDIAVRCAADGPGAFVVLAFHETPRSQRTGRRALDKGRSLGLAAGYEAIERSGGSINVIRRDGATITQISLPRAEQTGAASGGTRSATGRRGAGRCD